MSCICVVAVRALLARDADVLRGRGGAQHPSPVGQSNGGPRREPRPAGACCQGRLVPTGAERQRRMRTSQPLACLCHLPLALRQRLIRLTKSVWYHRVVSCVRLQEPGSGACATVGSSQVLVGNKEWLETSGVLLPAIASLDPGSGTHVHVAVGTEYAGKVTLQDEVRDGAAHVVATLQKMGVRPVMLSGMSL